VGAWGDNVAGATCSARIPGQARVVPTSPAADRGAFHETHPDKDEGPVEVVEIVSLVDGRRDLTNLF
jgi:hypothetical protein